MVMPQTHPSPHTPVGDAPDGAPPHEVEVKGSAELRVVQGHRRQRVRCVELALVRHLCKYNWKRKRRWAKKKKKKKKKWEEEEGGQNKKRQPA